MTQHKRQLLKRHTGRETTACRQHERQHVDRAQPPRCTPRSSATQQRREGNAAANHRDTNRPVPWTGAVTVPLRPLLQSTVPPFQSHFTERPSVQGGGHTPKEETHLKRATAMRFSRPLVPLLLCALACLLLLALLQRRLDLPHGSGHASQQLQRWNEAEAAPTLPSRGGRVDRHALALDGVEYALSVATPSAPSRLLWLLHHIASSSATPAATTAASAQEDSTPLAFQSCVPAEAVCTPTLTSFALDSTWHAIQTSPEWRRWIGARISSAQRPSTPSSVTCLPERRSGPLQPWQALSNTELLSPLVQLLSPRSPSSSSSLLFAGGASEQFSIRCGITDRETTSASIRIPLFEIDAHGTKARAKSAHQLRQSHAATTSSSRYSPFHTMGAVSGAASSSSGAAASFVDPSLRDYPFEAPELIFSDTSSVWAWFKAFFDDHWGGMHPFPTWPESPLNQSGRFHLRTGASIDTPGSWTSSETEDDEEVRIALLADWASGTRESDLTARAMMGDGDVAFDAHYTLHVGDIYLVGSAQEVASNCLGIPPPGAVKGVKFPHGTRGAFATAGNHESFFDTFLPTLGVCPLAEPPSTVAPACGADSLTGQHASYFSLENRWWRLVVLDTGYGSWSPTPLQDARNNSQPSPVLQWLIDEVRLGDPLDTRGIVIFTHHQSVSAFELAYPATAAQLADIIPEGVTVLFLWGHEHRFAVYGLNHLQFETVGEVTTARQAGTPPASSSSSLSSSSGFLRFYSRCIGHGGFPSSIQVLPSLTANNNLEVFDDRLYALSPGDSPMPVGFNGFSRMRLKRDRLTLEYWSLSLDQESHAVTMFEPTLLMAETFVAGVDATKHASNLTYAGAQFVHSELTRVAHTQDGQSNSATTSTVGAFGWLLFSLLSMRLCLQL